MFNQVRIPINDLESIDANQLHIFVSNDDPNIVEFHDSHWKNRDFCELNPKDVVNHLENKCDALFRKEISKKIFAVCEKRYYSGFFGTLKKILSLAFKRFRFQNTDIGKSLLNISKEIIGNAAKLAIDIVSIEDIAFQKLTGNVFNPQTVSDLQYFIYDGILLPIVENDDPQLVLNNIKELTERSPKNVNVVANAALALAKEGNNEELVQSIDQFLAKTELKNQNSQFLNDSNTENQLISCSSSKSKWIALGLLTILGLSGAFLFYNALQKVSPAQNPILNQESEDLCQREIGKDICENNFGIPRNQMPQVQNEILTNYLSMKKQQGIEVMDETIAASNLTPVQKEMLVSKVFGMIEDAQNGNPKDNPCNASILVASQVHPYNGSYVIDGHHRYAACKLLGGIQKVIHVYDCEIKVLSELRTFPSVKTLDLKTF